MLLYCNIYTNSKTKVRQHFITCYCFGNSILNQIPRGFHIEHLQTSVASQQRTLTPPDTWSCPIWDLHVF